MLLPLGVFTSYDPNHADYTLAPYQLVPCHYFFLCYRPRPCPTPTTSIDRARGSVTTTITSHKRSPETPFIGNVSTGAMSLLLSLLPSPPLSHADHVDRQGPGLRYYVPEPHTPASWHRLHWCHVFIYILRYRPRPCPTPITSMDRAPGSVTTSITAIN
jgi:hypothetical protein